MELEQDFIFRVVGRQALEIAGLREQSADMQKQLIGLINEKKECQCNHEGEEDDGA